MIGQRMRPETRHSLVLLAGTGTTACLSIVYAIYAGRKLGVAAYADFAAAVSLVNMGHIALGPINGTVARFAAQYRSRNENGKILALSRAVTRRVARYGLVGFAVGLLLVRPLANLLQFSSVWPLITAYLMTYLTLLICVPRGVLRGVQSFGQHSLNIISESGLRLVVGLVLLVVIGGVVSSLAAYVVATTAALLLAHVQLRRVWSGCRPEPVDAEAIKRYTVPLLIMMVTSAGFQNVDLFFAKHYFAPAEAGAYGAAFTLARMIGVLVTPFTILLLPMLTTLHEQGRRLAGTFLRVCIYFLLLAVGPVLIFAFWPHQIVKLYGADYAAAAGLLLPLTIARLLGYLAHMFALVGAAVNRFGFLLVYVPGLVLEGVLIMLWHDSLLTIVLLTLGVELLTLAGMSACLLRLRGRRPPVA